MATLASLEKIEKIKMILAKTRSKSLRIASLLRHSLQGKVHSGYCPICESNVHFIKERSWLRDNYFCSRCRSIPRQRAIIVTLNLFCPDWKNLAIHESSPGGVSSGYLAKNCSSYTSSQFFQDVPYGQDKGGVRCENLEGLTLSDNSLDIFVTQDVFEHVMHPALAFKEINRVLKPGGMHVFTMPWYPNLKRTVQRARFSEGEIEFLEKPIYHGNPISEEGSLVTFDWGLDFTEFIYESSGMFTTTYLRKDKSMGLEAEFLEVFVSRKPLLHQ